MLTGQALVVVGTVNRDMLFNNTTEPFTNTGEDFLITARTHKII